MGDAPRNVVNISIPTAVEPGLAPPGKHVVHAYYAANEPYDDWAQLKRGSPQYEALKAERAEGLWKGLEHIIPDIRQRASEGVAHVSDRYSGPPSVRGLDVPRNRRPSRRRQRLHRGEHNHIGLGPPPLA